MRAVRAALVIGLVLLAAAAGAEPYRLQPGDALSLRVIRISELDTVARIDDTGHVRLPFAGRVEVAGRTLDAAAETIARRIVDEAGVRREALLLSIHEYRPVYVLTDGPGGGEVTYRPGLRVLQAAALARRGREESRTSLIEVMEGSRTAFTRREVAEQLAAARVARARLVAEREERPFEMPELSDLGVGETRLAELAQVATSLLDMRRASLDRRAARLDDQSRIVADQLDKLREELELQDEKLSILRPELANLNELGAAGLTTQFRLNSVRSQILDAELARVRTIGEIAQLESQLTVIAQQQDDLRAERRLQITSRIEELDSRIEQLETRLAGAKRDQGIAAAYLGIETAETREDIRYRIHRTGPSGALEIIEAEAGDPLQPGDVLELTLR